MAKDMDFEAWGCKFIDVVVSESIFVELNLLMNFLSGSIIISLPSLGNQLRIKRLSRPLMKRVKHSIVLIRGNGWDGPVRH
jgi:hypothetical protein